MRVIPKCQTPLSKGFTLVELVIGIVLFSVAMVTIVSVIMPQAKRAIDPLWQVRGVSLAQSLLTEISSKAFDEASITSAGISACNHGGVSCTESSSLGPDLNESRSNFDDIDDYHNLVLTTGAEIVNTSGAAINSDMADLFLGFEARVSVFYDDNSDGIADGSGTYVGNLKLISVVVITPGGEQIPFAAYRRNL
jgi:MSHA pilin protein MshD